MHYPFWYVPVLTSPIWIAVVAVLHMYAAMYAVGGSILLSAQTGLAYRSSDGDYLGYLRTHAWFFVLFTTIFGALSGVGIWWTIGLASPLATEELIHVFVLIWAIEYLAFFVEITSGFIFFYYWGRLDSQNHLRMGWIYAGAAFVSLLAITPITSFQINNGNWVPGDGVARAFFNPQAFPQIIARTGASLLLAALYFFLHVTLKAADKVRVRDCVGRESAKWAILGAVLTLIGGVTWYINLPPTGSAAISSATVLNVLTVIIFALSAGVVLMVYVGPIRNPSWLNPGFAFLFLGFGLAATGTGEFIRESVRKPYIVYNRVLGSQIRPEAVTQLRRSGYIAGGVWTSAYVRDKYPRVLPVSSEAIDQSVLRNLPARERRDVGRVIYMNHCNDCHAISFGYNAVAQLTRGWSRDLVYDSVIHLNEIHFFMPPWAGMDAEAEVLTDYLMSVRHPYPLGFAHGEGSGR